MKVKCSAILLPEDSCIGISGNLRSPLQPSPARACMNHSGGKLRDHACAREHDFRHVIFIIRRHMIACMHVCQGFVSFKTSCYACTKKFLVYTR